MRRSTLVACVVLLVAWGALAVGAPRDGGYALEFDGVDDYVVIDDPALAWGPLTIEAWIRPDDAEGGRIVSNRDGSDGFELDMYDGAVYLIVNGNGLCSYDVSDRIGEWFHVAAVWDGPGEDGLARIYIDGMAGANGGNPAPMNGTSSNLHIGRAAWYLYFFHGAIDEVRIFNVVVDEATLLTWSHRLINDEHPDYGSLEGAWSFEEGTGQTLEDSGWQVERDGWRGSSADADPGDPTWIVSGMVATEGETWSTVKALFAR